MRFSVVKERTLALERSNRELEQFAYVASHDLQEPLRMIASYVQLLSRRYKGRLDTDADEFIGFAAEGAARLQNMINDLLHFSLLAKQPADFKRVDCETALEQALANLKLAIQDSGAIITHDPLPVLMADQALLVTLFQNLAQNAIKFRGEATPRIHFSAELKDANSVSTQPAAFKTKSYKWFFAVKDNGIGIEPQYFGRVFLIFQRLNPVGKYPGTGIGLAACKKIVEQLGGHIWIESQPGKGSTFYFTIPADKQEAKENE